MLALSPIRPYTAALSSFDIRKEQLLDTLLRWIVILGAIAYIPSLIACIVGELYVLAAVDTAAYLVVLIIFFAKRTPYRLRLVTVVLVSLAVGGAVLFQTGTDGAGHVWLLFAVFVSALLGEARMNVATVILTQLVMLGYVAAGATGLLRHEFYIVGVSAISANVLLVSIALSLITHRLLSALELEIRNREHTLQLLDHRVKNNLQAVESLVAMSDDGDEKLLPLCRRIRALSSANELLLSEPGSGSVNLKELLRVITNPRDILVSGESAVRVRPEKLTETTVGFSDLFALLASAAPLNVTLRGTRLTIAASKGVPDDNRLGSRIAESLVPPEWISRSDTSPSDGILALDLPL